MTFLWPLSEEREAALEMLEEREINPEKMARILESSDFVAAETGLEILKNPDLYEPPDYTPEQRQKLLAALEDMSNQKTPGGIEYTAIEAIGYVGGSEAIDVLTKKAQKTKSGDYHTQTYAIEALGYAGDAAVPTLKKLIEEAEELGTERKALNTLGKMASADAVTALTGLIEDDTGRRSVKAIAIRNLGIAEREEVIPSLESFAFHEDRWYRKETAGALVRIGSEGAFAVIRRMAREEQDSSVRYQIAEALSLSQSETAEGILQVMCNDADKEVRKQADWALTKIRADREEAAKRAAARKKDTGQDKTLKSWLFASRKAALATPHTKEALRRFTALGEISEELTKRYPEHFIGVVVVGSTAKGYLRPESDIDAVLLVKEEKRQKIAAAFKKLLDAHNVRLCGQLHKKGGYYLGIGEEDEIDVKTERLAPLFQGLFFGNREKLLDLQVKALEQMDRADWEQLREYIRNREKELFKAGLYFDLEDQKMEEARRYVALLRVPPPYEEMKAILAKKMRRLERKKAREAEKKAP